MKKKHRTPRFEQLSEAWLNLVCQWAEINKPTKKQIRDIGRLWAAGYSHKDAGLLLKDGQ